MAWVSRKKTTPTVKLFQRGWTAGYTVYRYGSSKPASPKLAESIIAGDARKRVLRDVQSVLLGWRSSPFEFEGALRAAVRSALCLEGHSWSEADAEANGLLAACFQRMSARRPTWEQAQREYAHKQDYCARCAGPIPDDLRRTGQVSRYCSSECAKSALLASDEKTIFRHSAAGIAAYRLIKRETMPSKDCRHCGASYKPSDIFNFDQMYCSIECRNTARRVLRPIVCMQCNHQFRPYRSGQIFCNDNCRKSFGGRVKTYNLSCTFCSSSFVAKTENTAYCSNKCRSSAYYYRGKVAAQSQPESNVIYLTPELFDREFSRPSMSSGGQGTEYIRGTG